MLSGAKACKSCRSCQEFSNEYLVFTCKIRLRYSRERASPSLDVMQFTFSIRSLLAALPAPAPSGAEPGSLANSIRSRIRMLSAKTNFGQPVLGCLATKLTERTVANPALRGVHLVPEEGLREPEESLHLRNVGKKLRIEVEGNLFQATYVPNVLPFLISQMFLKFLQNALTSGNYLGCSP